jgi:hypothetical protein
VRFVVPTLESKSDSRMGHPALWAGLVLKNFGWATCPVSVGDVEGAVLVDQLKSMDWVGRKAEFHSKAPAFLVSKVRQYIAVLLQIQTR